MRGPLGAEMPSWCGQVCQVQEQKLGEAGASGSAGRPGGAWEVAFMEGEFGCRLQLAQRPGKGSR